MMNFHAGSRLFPAVSVRYVYLQTFWFTKDRPKKFSSIRSMDLIPHGVSKSIVFDYNKEEIVHADTILIYFIYQNGLKITIYVDFLGCSENHYTV